MRTDDPRVQRARDVLKYRAFGDPEGVIRDLLDVVDEQGVTFETLAGAAGSMTDLLQSEFRRAEVAEKERDELRAVVERVYRLAENNMLGTVTVEELNGALSTEGIEGESSELRDDSENQYATTVVNAAREILRREQCKEEWVTIEPSEPKYRWCATHQARWNPRERGLCSRYPLSFAVVIEDLLYVINHQRDKGTKEDADA